jgi:arylsulfatase A-like enzyme
MNKLTLCLAFCISVPAIAADKPNVLMIAIDDLNDWVGPLKGHPQVQTPHMDRLAARGTTFLNAHCQSPLCNPSRTSLMTGRRPSTTGIYGLAPWFRNVEQLKDIVTLPQHFKAAGYRTLTTGKIYHGGYPPRKTRATEFDEWGPNAGVGARPKEKLVTTPMGNHPLVDWGVFPHKDEDKGDWKVASWAVDRLEEMPTREKKDEPFFMACGFFLPHVPCYATQKWFDLYPNESLKMPPILKTDREDTPDFSWYLHWTLPEPRLSWLEDEKQLKPLVRAYLASVSFVDSQVGRVLDALEASGEKDNTIVVLWSDHGWHLGEKAISGKNSLWERSTRVPLIFAGPGVAADAECSKPAELLDLYPTLSEMCGLPNQELLEGHSLVPQLKDASAEREWPAITTHCPGNHGVRTEHHRYIRYADGSEELYDLRRDPNEWKNIARYGHDELIERHRKWAPVSSAPPAPNSKHRILVRDGDKWIWEGKPIDPTKRWE